MPVFSTGKSLIKKRWNIYPEMIILILCLLFLLEASTSLAGPSPILLKGKVISLKESTAIPNVHIINLNSAKATISCAEGWFWIPAAAGDSLHFQAIGFETLVLFVRPGLVIERQTGLNDRAEINAFLIYCGITDEYVVNTREAEVYARLIACYETWVAEGK